MIERSHLEILTALSRTGSLTRAAEELHLTQPALTHSIRKLESLCGTPLWRKEGRALSLTQAGRHLLKTADDVLPRLSAADQALQAFGQGKRGRLRLGVECHPCFEYITAFVSSFLNRWPDVDFDLTRDFQFDGLSALEERVIDILVTPDELPRTGIVYTSILDFELQLIVDSNHRLAASDSAQPQDLADQTLFTYPIALERLDVYTRFLNPAGIRPAARIPIEAVEIMVQLVAAGRGVSTFPDWLIRRYAAEAPVTGVRLGTDGIHKHLYIAHRSEDSSVGYISDFLQIAGGCCDAE